MNHKAGLKNRIKCMLMILSLLFLIMSSYPQTVSGSWPMFLNDPEHSGNSTSSAPLINATLWSVANIGGNSYSSPVAANGRVFVNRGGAGTLYCLYARNGTEIWTQSIGIDGQRSSTPAVYQGKVYIVGDRLYCFYENNGTEIWNRNLVGGGVGTSSPTISEGKVFVNTQILYCFDADDGTDIWNKSVGGSEYSSTPAMANGKVFVNADQLYCLFAENGTEIWNISSGGLANCPTVVNGRVFYTPNRIVCLYENNGTEIWSRPGGGDGYSTPAVANGMVYVVTTDRVKCYYESNGTSVWSVSVDDGDGCTTPAISKEGNVYVVRKSSSSGGVTYCLNGSTGATIWSHVTGGSGYSSSAIAYGSVFVNAGRVYCYGAPSPTVDYIQIRDAPEGGGKDLCDPANYPGYFGGSKTTLYAAAYNYSAPGDGYIMDVPASFYWESSDWDLASVTPTDAISTLSTNASNFGPLTVTLTDIEGHTNTTQVTILEPTVDYVLIRDSPNGTGKNLCDPANYLSYPLGLSATFYGAEYNYSMGYLGDVPASSVWLSNDISLVTVTSPGSSTVISCSSINNGTAIITLDIGGGITNTTSIAVINAQIDYIQIRNAPEGGGINLCEAGNFPIFPVGHTTTFYAAAYNGSEFLSDIPVFWSSSNESLVTVTAYGGSTQITCSESQFGSVSILADYSFGLAESTIITILPPTIDHILIRDEPQGGGSNLCDPSNYPIFPVGSNFTFYGAGYNLTSGFLEEVPSSSTWTSSNDSLVGVTAVGISTLITCSETNFGIVTITLDDGEGHLNSTQVSVLEPSIDFIQIRDAPGDLAIVLTSVDFKLGEVITDRFYCAVYNHTAGYIGERAAQWWIDVDIGTLFPQLGIYTNFTATTQGIGNLSADLNGLLYTMIITVEPEDVIITLDSPTGLSVEQVEGGGALKLSWDPYTGSDFAGFKIYRSSDGGFSFELIDTGGLFTNTSYLNSGLTNGVTYHYYITALDAAGNESPSSSIKYNTPEVEQKQNEQDFPWLQSVFVIILIVIILLFVILVKRKKERVPVRTFMEMENVNEPGEDPEPQPEKEEEPPIEGNGEPPLNDEGESSAKNLNPVEDEI